MFWSFQSENVDVNDVVINVDYQEIDLIFEELCSRKIDWICAIHAEKEYNQNSNCVQDTHTLEYKIAYDDRLFDYFSGNETKVQTEIQKLMAHVQTQYCHKDSLGAQIQFQVRFKYLL